MQDYDAIIVFLRFKIILQCAIIHTLIGLP